VASRIVQDPEGNVYITGSTESSEGSGFPVQGGPDLTHNGGADAFVAKIDASGSDLAYCGYVGGQGVDWGYDIARDDAMNVYIVGYTTSPESEDFPGPVGPDSTHNGDIDAFVAKIGTLNQPPVVTITAPEAFSLFPVDQPITFQGSFTDPDVSDTHTAEWAFDAATVEQPITLPGTVDQDNDSVSLTTSFDTPGVYHITLAVADNSGGQGVATTVNNEHEATIVVYNPEGGFVTGGGWIDSPPEAYRPDLTLTGKANFGFVSKYKKGTTTPTGQTEFQFKVADLNFHSDSYEWLVVAGARAQFKGTGTINGSGEYKFMLKALDAAINENDAFDVDRFRIKIWEEDEYGSESVIYDNGLGAEDDDDNAMTEIGGGSIVIHKAK
jgi:hypothetical protein